MSLNNLLNFNQFFERVNVEEFETELLEFLNEWVDNTMGLESATPIVKDNGKYISISATEEARLGYPPSEEILEEWKRTGDELIEELDMHEFGQYEICDVSSYHVDVRTPLWKDSEKLNNVNVKTGVLERVNITKASKASKNLLADGEPLKNLNISQVGKNLAFYFEEKGNFLFPKGKFFGYFYDNHENVQKLAKGEFDMLPFPHRRRFDWNAAPITDIWKKSHAKSLRGTEHILGALEGQVYYEDKLVTIEMMSVRTGFKENKINTFLCEAVREMLEEKFPDFKLCFEDPTDDGLEFVAKYNPNAVIYWTYGNRPKAWKKLREVFPNVLGKPESNWSTVIKPSESAESTS